MFLGACVIMAFIFNFLFIHFIHPHRKGIKKLLDRIEAGLYHIAESTLIPREHIETAPIPSSVTIDPRVEALKKAQAAIVQKRKEKLAVLEDTTYNNDAPQQILSDANIDNVHVPTYDYAPRKGNSADRIATKHGMYLEELFNLNSWLRANPDHIEWQGPNAKRIKVRAWKLYRMKWKSSPINHKARKKIFKIIARKFQVSEKALIAANMSLWNHMMPNSVVIIPCPIGK